jgi:hypothetical protein
LKARIDELPHLRERRILGWGGRNRDDTTYSHGGKGAKKKPKGPKGKDEPGGIVQVEQGLEFREVPVDNLFAFLDGVEQSRDLLFVTRLDIARKFNDMSHVRSMVTLATFHYSGGEPAGAAPGPAAGSEAPKPAGEEAP